MTAESLESPQTLSSFVGGVWARDHVELSILSFEATKTPLLQLSSAPLDLHVYTYVLMRAKAQNSVLHLLSFWH